MSFSRKLKPRRLNSPRRGAQCDDLWDEQAASCTLGSGSLRQAVKLPEGEDRNEWLAINTVDFFNQVSMLYGTVTDFCTEHSCAIMSAGPRYEYRWADGRDILTPIQCSAPQYIDYLMTWVQDQLDDEGLFPSRVGAPFPENFDGVAKVIMKRLFRVYAHIYHHHFAEVLRMGEEAHLNTSFKHFMFFVQEFELIKRRELQPLREVIDRLTGGADARAGEAGAPRSRFGAHPKVPAPNLRFPDAD